MENESLPRRHFTSLGLFWQRTTAHSDTKQGAKHYGRIHDTILYYTKSNQVIWNPQYTPHSKEYVEKFYRHIEPKTGRRYMLDNLAGPGGASKGNPYYEVMGVKRYWQYSKEKMAKLIKQGRVVQTKPGNVPRLKRYFDELKGVPLQSLWLDIPPIPSQSKERLGYPTQKPEALLERIVNSSSNTMDVVLDPFCGCGTTLVVAHKLGRRWVGIDVSPTACNLMENRMRRLGVSPNVMGMPLTEEDLRKLPPFEFQNWVVRRLFGRVSSRRSSDMGIDGYTFEGIPIQVKQSDDIGRNVVDNFETAIRRRKTTKGIIVAFSFGKGAYEEIARARLRENLEIKALTVRELLANRSKTLP